MPFGASGARAYGLYVSGQDLIEKAPLDEMAIRGELGGPGNTGRLEWIIEDPSIAVDLPGGAVVRFEDLVNGRRLFHGRLLIRRSKPRRSGRGRYVECTALDDNFWLDVRQVPRWSSKATFDNRNYRILNDRNMVQDLVERYGGPLVPPNDTVDLTETGMDVVDMTAVSLREAIEIVADEAQVATESPRRFYVDDQLRVHYYDAKESLAAPYRIADGSYIRDVITTSGLVEYWSLREASGTFFGSQGVANASGNGGITRDQTSIGVVNEPAYRSIRLDGVNDYVDASAAALHPGNVFSLECWFRRDTSLLGTQQTLFSAGTNDYELRFNTSDQLVLRKEGVAADFVTDASYTDGDWHHLVVTHNGSDTDIWVDGANKPGTLTLQTIVAGSGAINIGREKSTATDFFKGWLQDAAVYDAVLSSATIGAHYDQGISITPEDLVLVRDDLDTVHDVYVRAKGDNSGWVRSASDFEGSNAAIQEIIERRHVGSVAARNRAGRAFLRRNRRVTSGSFSTHRGGWKPGQIIYITDDALGLSSDAQEVRSVSFEMGPGGVEDSIRWSVDFGAPRRRLSREIRRHRRR